MMFSVICINDADFVLMFKFAPIVSPTQLQALTVSIAS
jgi:hypothetical protein